MTPDDGLMMMMAQRPWTKGPEQPIKGSLSYAKSFLLTI